MALLQCTSPLNCHADYGAIGIRIQDGGVFIWLWPNLSLWFSSMMMQNLAWCGFIILSGSMVRTLVGNFDFRFRFLGPPSEAEFRFRFRFRRFRLDFILNSASVEKSTNQNSDSEIKIIRRNSLLLVSYQKTISKRLPPSLHLLKMVVAIPTSTQNSCAHSYIYSKLFPPYLHLIKTVASIPTSTQNGCRHTYIYSKQLPPYLHLLKTVTDISTSTQNE